MRPTAAGDNQEPCPVGWAGTLGTCSRCSAGKQASDDRTECNNCYRQLYNPDGQAACTACEFGSVPNAMVGASFCVPCELKDEPLADPLSLEFDPRYSTTDWEACQFWGSLDGNGDQNGGRDIPLVPGDKITPSQEAPGRCTAGYEPNDDNVCPRPHLTSFLLPCVCLAH